MVGNKRVVVAAPPPAKRFKKAGAVSHAKTFQPKQTFKPRLSAGPVSKQLESVKKALRRTAPELKYVDVDVTQVNINTPGTVESIFQIAQGDTQGARDGNSVRVKSISLLGAWHVGTSPIDDSFYRLAMVQDLQTISDTAPAITDMFSSADPRVSFPSLVHLGRWKYLWVSDLINPDNMVATVGTHKLGVQWEWTGDLLVQYNSTAITDIQKNEVVFVILSNDTDNTVDFTGSVRIGFIDV